MKTLKYFIVLFGVMTLVQTTINAQLHVTMDFPNGDIAQTTEVTGETTTVETDFGSVEATGSFHSQAEIEVTLESINDIPMELVVRVYSRNNPGEILEEKTSGSPTTSYTTIVSFDSTMEFNNGVWVECGYIDRNGNYRSDSGCIVIIQP